MKSIFLLVALVAGYPKVTAWSGCPSKEDMLPCECTRLKGYTNITCDGSLSVIQDGLEIISKYWMGVDRINFLSYELKVLGARAFGKADLHDLVLATPNLVRIDPDCFRTNERQFTRLIIMQSAIRNLEDVLPALKDVLNLKELVITNSNSLREVKRDAFFNAFENHVMRDLDLSNNAITSIGENAFSHLRVLYNLKLKGNNIQSFHPTAISSPNQIRILDLSYNKMSVLPVTLIKNMNQRQKLLLMNNMITKVPLDDIRAAAKEMVEIHLEGNQINCDSSFKFLALMNYEKKFHLMKGTCAEPAKLNGIDFNMLNITDF